MVYHERRLPHWQVIGQPLFVTFRLHDSLPASRIFLPENLSSGRAFVAMDLLLDHPQSGPVHLSLPEIARMVVDSIRDGEARFGRYELHAFVVMPNHVHMLITPRTVSKHWLGPLKGFTGLTANRMLGRSGPFWQDESYDRLVRDSNEFSRISAYIADNPVRAGLALDPERYPWSGGGL